MYRVDAAGIDSGGTGVSLCPLGQWSIGEDYSVFTPQLNIADTLAIAEIASALRISA